jgi:hypothetical protein
MRRRTSKALILAALATLLAGGAPGQEEPDLRPSGEEVDGMIDAYILSKLQDALVLSDEEFGRMVVAQKKMQDARRAYRRKRNEVIREMRQALRRDDAGEGELAPLLARLDEMHQKFLEEERTRYRDVDAILDVRQRARYRIFEAEVQRRLQQLIRESRRPER